MSTARDRYPDYFAERLWDWLPAIHRELDALEGGDALRALLRAFGSQAAIAKRSQDRLWDDMFVELADDWAVPYIAQLVGTRLVSALNPRARRADVAKTIYYRRRKGTLAVLEQLVADIGGWEGKVVEEFRRLARMRHGLDGPPRAGRVTGTPEGGFADLRSVRGARLAGDPFDEYHYTPETRRPRERLGLRGIQTLGFHLYRLKSVALRGVVPRLVNNLAGTRDGYTFDPSGRDTPLFAKPTPPDWERWRTAAEWGLPRAIDCRLLNEAIFRIGDEEIGWILSGAPIGTMTQRRNAAADLRLLVGERFVGREALLRVLAGLPQAAILTDPGVLAGLLPLALDPDCGSFGLADAIQVRVLPGPPVERDRRRGADLAAWPTPVIPGVDLLIDPARGRFLFDPGAAPPASLRVDYRIGMGAAIGAGAVGREIDSGAATLHWQMGSTAPGTPATGVLELDDSSTFANPPNQNALTDLTIRAAEDERPYVRLAANWQLGASGENRTLTIDGLWIGALPGGGQLRLSGDFARVTLRCCTLDPGGLDAMGGTLPRCGLVIAGTIDELVIERCILPGISLTGAANVDHILISDSIIDCSRPAALGVRAPRARVTMARCTIIGSSINSLCLDVEKLDATDSLVAARADVTDVQSGCFRFSARGPLSRVPHPYASHHLDDLERLFMSRRFADPNYAALSPRAPAALLDGSEEGCEVGAYCGERRPVRMESLRTKVEEYMPFGRLPAYIMEN